MIYDGAPHSFFDRKQEEFAEARTDAWRRDARLHRAPQRRRLVAIGSARGLRRGARRAGSAICLDGEPRLTEKKMFGGLAFLVGGNMAIAASGQGGVLVRVDPARVGRARRDDGGRGRGDARPADGRLAPPRERRRELGERAREVGRARRRATRARSRRSGSGQGWALAVSAASAAVLSPSSGAIGCSAATTFAMCSSSSSPRSSAPA